MLCSVPSIYYDQECEYKNKCTGKERKGQESYVYLDRVDGVHDGVFGDTGKGTSEQAGGERGVLGQGLVIVVNLGLSHSCVCKCAGGEGEWSSAINM